MSAFTIQLREQASDIPEILRELVQGASSLRASAPMLSAPIPATRKALDISGLRLSDIGAFER